MDKDSNFHEKYGVSWIKVPTFKDIEKNLRGKLLKNTRKQGITNKLELKTVPIYEKMHYLGCQDRNQIE